MEEKNKKKYYYNGPLDFKDKKGFLRAKIGISGAAETGHCGLGALESAKELGREVVRQGGILITGATTGFPLWSAMGAKEENGVSIGFSPAATQKEHLETYRLPIDYMDLVVYTGFGFPGRDLLFTRSCDAIVIGCGRIGTLHEFTVAYEDNKPIGVLEGPWTMDEQIKDIMEKSNRPSNRVVYDSDPKALIEKLMKMVEEDREKGEELYISEIKSVQ